eukprot:m.35791 g.35791  ORF g.35791 m.35791 type:complete len:222 (+) comp5739_c0_seq1:596-1261(+)
MAQGWTPMSTVILLLDAKARFSPYLHQGALDFDSFRTVLFENPRTREAEDLQRFCQTRSAPRILDTSTATEDLGLCSAGKILETLEGKHLSQSKCAVFCEITRVWTSTRPKCTRGCRPRPGTAVPPSDHCSVCNSSMSTELQLAVDLSDHTGTLERCWVATDVADQLFPDLTAGRTERSVVELLVPRCLELQLNRAQASGRSRASVIGLKPVGASELLGQM